MSFRIWELDAQGRAKVSIQSDRATLTFDDVSDEILLTLKNGSAERSRADDPESLRKPLPSARFDELVIKLPLNDIMGKIENGGTPLKRMNF